MLTSKIPTRQLVTRRTFILTTLKLGLLSLLASRMCYMQLIKKDEYKTLADKNRISLIVIAPQRGLIYDACGKVLADNVASFRLLLDKMQQNYLHELELINQLLNLDKVKYLAIVQKCAKANRRSLVTILEHLSWQQISIIEENKIYFSALFIDVGKVRTYTFGIVTSHLLGYTGQVNEQELNSVKLINQDFKIGKSGIEKSYEEQLRGKFGYRQMEVNAYGKHIRELTTLPSTRGQNLYLNIDGELQAKTWRYLNRQGCSVVVMNCHSGNILLLASVPGFEPDNFSKLSTAYWQSLISDPHQPLINRPVQNHYSPGSAFKLITILAALESGVDPAKTVTCTGAAALKGGSFRCASKSGHGRLDMFGALKYSCNAYMYKIAQLIGADKIIEVATKFGFGKATGVDLPGEVMGLVPTKQWKAKHLKSNWTLGDTLNLSIGQGFLLATPMQLVRFTAALSNGGKLLTPCVAKRDNNSVAVAVDPCHLAIVKSAMQQAVNTQGGTAYTSRILNPKYQLAGKTGTVQVQSKVHADDDLSDDSILRKKRNHAVFIGFGPYDNPHFAISVFVDHGGGGGRAAAPIASRIMKDVFEKYC